MGACAASHANRAAPPTRDDFVGELMVGAATDETAEFSDQPKSYHADKLDVLAGLRAYHETHAADAGGGIAGAIVIGPTGVLWEYHVMTFVREGDRYQANWLVFPHARITYKAIMQVSTNEYRDVLTQLGASKALIAGAPIASDISPEQPDAADSKYTLLAVDWSSGQEKVWYSTEDPDRHPALKPLLENLNTLLMKRTTTYGK